MHVSPLIEKKRDGHALTAKEINSLMEDFTVGEIPDYQMSAWAMAVLFRGMTPAETRHLTDSMMRSGRILRYPDGSPPKVPPVTGTTPPAGDPCAALQAQVDAVEAELKPPDSMIGLSESEKADIMAARRALAKQLAAVQRALNNCRKSHPR
jgi:Glycosyl transferase family, helical bundle domain